MGCWLGKSKNFEICLPSIFQRWTLETQVLFLCLYVKLISPVSQVCSRMWFFWEGVAIKIPYVLSTLRAEANASQKKKRKSQTHVSTVSIWSSDLNQLIFTYRTPFFESFDWHKHSLWSVYREAYQMEWGNQFLLQQLPYRFSFSY